MSEYQIGEKPYEEPKPNPSVGMGERKSTDYKRMEDLKEAARIDEFEPDKVPHEHGDTGDEFIDIPGEKSDKNTQY